MRMAEVHFEAGYVPDTKNVQTLRRPCVPLVNPFLNLPADKISMARLLTQLFEVTEQFDMVTQPQLLLLQKTMVVVEGVARTLNPNLNMWVTAEPVVRQWIERKLGPVGKIGTGGRWHAVGWAAHGAAIAGHAGRCTEGHAHAVRHGERRRPQA